MEKKDAKMISYVRNADENDFQKSTFCGEEIVLKAYSQRSFRFESAEGIRVVRINYQDSLKIKETYANITVEIKFFDDDFGEIKYSQMDSGRELSASFKTKLLDFKINSKEIYIRYIILDDLSNPLTESKIFLKTGDK